MGKTTIEYDIILKSDLQGKGTIDLDRMALLAESIINIAKGALQIRLGGISSKPGKTPDFLDKALKITLKGITESSTKLALESPTFADSLEGVQLNVFQPELGEELQHQTPMSLFMLAYKEAFDENDSEKNFLDKALLKNLTDLQSFFRSEDEELIISNRDSIPELHLKKSDFKRIKILEDAIPEPTNVVVNGIIDILEHSRSKITVKTEQGNLIGSIKNKTQQEIIKNFWGREATIFGTGHFKPNGRLSYVEIERIFEATEEDKHFSKVPAVESVIHQVKRQTAKHATKNWMNEIAGKWPGDETDEEFERLLKEL